MQTLKHCLLVLSVEDWATDKQLVFNRQYFILALIRGKPKWVEKNTLNFSYNASTQHKHVQYFERQYIIRLSITDYIQKGSKLHTDEINEQKQKKRDIVAYRRLQSRKEEEEDDLLQAFWEL